MSGRLRTVATGTSGALALALALALTAALGCRPKESAPPPTAPPTVEVEPPPPRRIDRELAAVADAFDPGEVEPLITAMPPWLASSLAGRVSEDESPEATLARARDDLHAWERASSAGDTSVASFVQIGRSLYLGERLMLAGTEDDADILVHLEKLYAALDQPFFTSERGFFQQAFGMLVEAAGREGVLGEQAQVGELVGYLRDAVGRAGPLKRRAAARILREHPDRPEIPAILRHLAEDASRAENFVQARDLSALALARTREPGSRELVDHAVRCYTALDLECGDAARERALAAPPATGDAAAIKAHEERLAGLEKTAARVREALALADKDGLDDRLRRARLLILLGHFVFAEALYNELKESFPGDARPYAGLAILVLERDYDFFGAAPIVRQGRALDNRDRDFYEIALGLAPGRLMAEVIPAVTQSAGEGDAKTGAKIDAIIGDFLREFREDAAGWATYEPGRAAVLITIADTLGKTLPLGFKGDVRRMHPALRRMVSDFEKTRRRYPEVGDAWQATYVASLFASDFKRAWKAASAPLPAALADDADLQRKRLRTLRNLVLLWERGEPIADLDAALASLPEALAADDEAIESRALVDYLRLREGDAAAGARAIDAYSGLAERRSGPAKAQALHNLGALRALSGDAEGAIAAWEEAIALADETGRDIIYLSAAINTLGPETQATFETLMKSQHTAFVRIQAAAWRAEVVRRGGGDAGAADKAYRELIAREASGELRAHLPLGRLGIIATGAFTVNLSYSLRTGLTTVLDVNATPWLIPPAPLTALDTKGAARPRAKASKAAG